MPLRKIRAKVVFFRELKGICVKKSGDFWTNEAGQRAKRGKHFAILAVLDEKHFAILAKVLFTGLSENEDVTCSPVYYAGLM
ncbi:MAG: hypothetical protein IKZ55_10780 [Bacteroidales bacterium]|nr:hypothetical protein [Bacteroidales bacterium]